MKSYSAARLSAVIFFVVTFYATSARADFTSPSCYYSDGYATYCVDANQNRICDCDTELDALAVRAGENGSPTTPPAPARDFEDVPIFSPLDLIDWYRFDISTPAEVDAAFATSVHYDVNGDGCLSVSDMLCVIAWLKGSFPSSTDNCPQIDCRYANCATVSYRTHTPEISPYEGMPLDVNGNGLITIDDVIAVITSMRRNSGSPPLCGSTQASGESDSSASSGQSSSASSEEAASTSSGQSSSASSGQSSSASSEQAPPQLPASCSSAFVRCLSPEEIRSTCGASGSSEPDPEICAKTSTCEIDVLQQRCDDYGLRTMNYDLAYLLEYPCASLFPSQLTQFSPNVGASIHGCCTLEHEAARLLDTTSTVPAGASVSACGQQRADKISLACEYQSIKGYCGENSSSEGCFSLCANYHRQLKYSQWDTQFCQAAQGGGVTTATCEASGLACAANPVNTILPQLCGDYRLSIAPLNPEVDWCANIAISNGEHGCPAFGSAKPAH